MEPGSFTEPTTGCPSGSLYYSKDMCSLRGKRTPGPSRTPDHLHHQHINETQTATPLMRCQRNQKHRANGTSRKRNHKALPRGGRVQA
jgi:hypothetical protein